MSSSSLLSSSSSSSSSSIVVPPPWDGKSNPTASQLKYVYDSAKAEMGLKHFICFDTMTRMLKVSFLTMKDDAQRQIGLLQQRIHQLQQPVIVGEGKVNLVRPSLPVPPIPVNSINIGTFTVSLEHMPQTVVDANSIEYRNRCPVVSEANKVPAPVDGKQEAKEPVPATVVDEQKPIVPLIPVPVKTNAPPTSTQGKIVTEKKHYHYTPYGQASFSSNSSAFSSTEKKKLNMKQKVRFLKGQNGTSLKVAMGRYKTTRPGLPGSSGLNVDKLVDRLRTHTGFEDFPCVDFFEATTENSRSVFPYVEPIQK